LKSVVNRLNFKDRVVQEPALPAQGAAASPQLRRPGQQQGENFELQWQMLRVEFPPAVQDGPDAGIDLKDRGMRFKPAVPCPEFLAHAKAASAAAAAYHVDFKKTTKSQRKRAKQRAKLARAADPGASAEHPSFLSPCDIPRARLFLCYHCDVQQDDKQLPSVHMEIDPFLPLVESLAEFDKRCSGQRSGAACLFISPNFTFSSLFIVIFAYSSPDMASGLLLLRFLTADTPVYTPRVVDPAAATEAPRTTMTS
jgi:hypothetical protein